VKKRIKAKYLPGMDPFNGCDAIAEQLDRFEKYPIAELNWPLFPYQPAAAFALAYQEDFIFLKYYVSEIDIKTTYLVSNEPVYRDSCVEFFIAIGEDEKYYNFEFNCIGTCLAAYGANRLEREFLSKSLIQKIQHRSSFKLKDGLVNWGLTLVIPIEVFCHHSLKTLKGLTGKANFYKCGDDLPVPHFLSWNPIKTEEPDFHQPGFFGDILFNEDQEKNQPEIDLNNHSNI
jgi:hypothetical protein